MIDFLLNPWPWWFSGAMISAVMFSLIFFGKSFGFSSNLRTICAMTFGRRVKFFDFDWKENTWNLTFLVGAALGGWISYQFMHGGIAVDLSEATLRDLDAQGFAAPTGMQPEEVFSWGSLMTLKGFLVLAVRGFLVVLVPAMPGVAPRDMPFRDYPTCSCPPWWQSSASLSGAS